MNNEAASNFKENFVKAFGMQGSYEITAVLEESLHSALRNMPLVREPDLTIDMRLNVDPFYGEPPHIMTAYADGICETITIVLDTSATSAAISSRLYKMAHHEIAHIAHYQQNADISSFNSPLGWVVKEGIAQHASDDGFYNYLHTKNLTLVQATDIALEELDKIVSGYYDDHSQYEFLFGGGQVDNRGYFVGSYLVSKLVMFESIELAELMQSPIERFRSFAKSELA
jgi:hypothetical protein